MSLKPSLIKIYRHPLVMALDRDRIAAAERGDIIHLALAMLDHVSGLADIERAIQQAFSSLGIARHNWDLMRDFVHPIMNALALPSVRAWFTRGITNLREIELVDADGKVFRIDRLIIGTAALTVIDFKVGNREQGHQAQVKHYRQLVEAIFDRPAHGYLLYLDEPAMVAVS
jgi:hypothetical protein